MSLNNLVVFFLMSILFLSCKKDEVVEQVPEEIKEELSCAQADWLGMYNGKYNCDGDIYEGIITVTAKGADEIVVSFVEDATISLEYDPVPVSGCDLNILDEDLEEGFTYSIDWELDGNNITLTDTYADSSANIVCVLAGVRI